MANERDKKYYWLKLPDGFFDDDTMQYLEEQENGKEHALIYLKLLVKSVRTDGLLFRLVGDNLLPYDEKFLAKVTNSTVDTIKVAMDRFQKLGLIELLETGEIYMKQINEMVGSETGHAKQKRLLRARETLSPDCLSNVSEMSHRERERERERDKELEIEINEIKTPSPVNKNDKATKKNQKHKYGSYSNVLFTDEEYQKLQEEYPTDWKERIEKVSDYCSAHGKTYSNYLAVIRNWAKKDKQEKQTKKAFEYQREIDASDSLF